MNKLLLVAAVLASVSLAQPQSLEDCLKQDSISCLQKGLYRKAKEFFNRESLELVSGVSLVKSKQADRESRSNNQVMADQEIDGANSVLDRQKALENFVADEAGNFMKGRSIKVNFAPVFDKLSQTARALTATVPEEIDQAVSDVAEGRTKKKIGKIITLLALAKAKIGLLATAAYFAIAFMAKKAIVVSIISLIISAFIGLRGILSKGGYSNAWNTGYSGGTAGGNTWTNPAQTWDEGHAGSYAGTQSQVYSGPGYH